MKILIVEDDKKLANYFKLGLEEISAKYQITLQFSGEEALQQIEKQSFDVIVTDIGLPKISGIDLLKKAKQIAKNYPNTIIITAYKDIELIKDAIKVDASAYLLKPLSVDELHENIQKCVNKKQVDKPKVLLVDDEKELCDTLKTGLETMSDSFEVFSAYSGEEAISIIEKHKINILVSDINMPGMNGIELMKEAKKRIPNIFIITLTIHGDADTALETVKIGAKSFIRKPVSIADLHQEINDGLYRQFVKEISLKHHDKLNVLINEKTKELISANNTIKGKNAELKEKNEEYQILNEEFSAQNEELNTLNQSLAISKDGIEKSEKKYRSVIENMANGFYRVDTQGDVTFTSPSVTKILGFSKEEIIGKPAASFYAYPEERNLFLEKIKETGKVEDYLVEFIRKGKPNIFIETNSQIIYKNGEYDGIEGVFSDVTKRKSIEQALIRSEYVLNETQKISKIGGWEYDVKSGQTYFSDEVFNIYGLPKDKMFKPEKGIEFYHPDDRELVKDSFAKVTYRSHIFLL